MNWQEIIFWLLIIDSLVAVIIAWTKLEVDFNKYPFIRRYFPITKGWSAWYFILVIFIGYLVYN